MRLPHIPGPKRHISFLCFKVCLFIWGEGARVRESGGGAERGRERERESQAGSRLSKPNAELQLRNREIMT